MWIYAADRKTKARSLGKACYLLTTFLLAFASSSLQGVKEHKCGICGREFTLLANMKRHVLIHTNIRAYQCHLCYKSFVQKQTLKAHMIVHSDVKPFKCKVGWGPWGECRNEGLPGLYKCLMGKNLHFISGATKAQSRSVANPKSICRSVPLFTTPMLTALGSEEPALFVSLWNQCPGEGGSQ